MLFFHFIVCWLYLCGHNFRMRFEYLIIIACQLTDEDSSQAALTTDAPTIFPFALLDKVLQRHCHTFLQVVHAVFLFYRYEAADFRFINGTV